MEMVLSVSAHCEIYQKTVSVIIRKSQSITMYVRGIKRNICFLKSLNFSAIVR